ncbi:hypothetical protein [Neolewinella persica]|uniref:hypothetical protein n=1 Tax=Neolewinella persica TaxID=70998 RepID=UPI00035E3669|nr:hypothetical protein [Neolewinella persica]
MRILLTALFFLALTPLLQADELSNRLRLILPGEDAPTVNERQFLYQRVSQLFRELEGDKVDKKSTKKKIVRIENRLHRTYLRSYAPNADLADAFRNGNYNDVTAAVLTALAYEYFDVEYEVYVDHWETYLIADPSGRAITSYQPSHEKHKDEMEASFRRDYLDLLRATIIDNLPNIGAKEVNELFERYYYPPDKKLSFGQLSALLLYRRAQSAYQAKNYQKSIDLLELALQKEERPAFLVLRKASELQLKAITQPDVEGDINTLFKQWAERPDNRYLPAAILQHFDEKQRLLLAENNLGGAADLLGNYLQRAPTGKKDWAKNLTDLQQYRLLRHHFTNGRMDLAQRLAESLFAEAPNDETMRFVLGELVIDALRRTRLTGSEFTIAVESAASRDPFIRKQDRFADLLLRELAWKVRDRYEADDLHGGTDALNHFRQALVDIPIGEKRSLWTLTAFIAASNYHFRMEEYQKARDFVSEGLRYNPNEEYFLHRRDLLQRY